MSQISYVLSKFIPDMAYGFTIRTNYGEHDISAEDAAPFLLLLKKQLERKLKAEQFAEPYAIPKGYSLPNGTSGIVATQDGCAFRVSWPAGVLKSDRISLAVFYRLYAHWSVDFAPRNLLAWAHGQVAEKNRKNALFTCYALRELRQYRYDTAYWQQEQQRIEQLLVSPAKAPTPPELDGAFNWDTAQPLYKGDSVRSCNEKPPVVFSCQWRKLVRDAAKEAGHGLGHQWLMCKLRQLRAQGLVTGAGLSPQGENALWSNPLLVQPEKGGL